MAFRRKIGAQNSPPDDPGNPANAHAMPPKQAIAIGLSEARRDSGPSMPPQRKKTRGLPGMPAPKQ